MGHRGERCADVVEGLGPADLADGIGQVHDEHRGQPVDREDELEAGEREGQRGEEQPTDQEGGPPPEGAHPPPRPDVKGEGEGQPGPAAEGGRADRKGDAHGQRSDRDDRPEPGRAAFAPSRRPNLGDERAPAAAEAIAFVDGPFDAQQHEHHDQERRPQLIARRRACRDRVGRACPGRRARTGRDGRGARAPRGRPRSPA